MSEDNYEDYTNSNISDSNNNDDDLDSQDEGFMITWPLLDLVASGFVAFLLLLSVILNLANISTVASISRLRSCGYFHILALLSAFNVVFFVVRALQVAFVTLERLTFLPTFISDWFDSHGSVSFWKEDLMFGLVGLQILLLCVMTLEHRINLSRQFFFKPKGQTCMRTFLTLLALSLVAASLAMASLVQFTDILFDSESKTSIIPYLTTYTVYLMVFTCLPAFVLVIVAVVNCVSAWNSTRLQPPEIKIAQKLDWKLAIVGSILLLSLVVAIIVSMASNINAYIGSEEILRYIYWSLERLIEMLLITIPITVTSVFGKRCCCWCCCRPCRPPIDDLDD